MGLKLYLFHCVAVKREYIENDSRMKQKEEKY